jgi:hypothetical protein
MGYWIATRYCALKTDALTTDEQHRSFREFCDDKLDELNGDPRDVGIDYSTYQASPKGKRLFIKFRKDWEKTELDRLFENGAYPECTLVTIVPDTATAVPADVLGKMDTYKEIESQKPAKRTAVLEDFELIEVFRRRVESIRNAYPNKEPIELGATDTEVKPKKKKPSGSGRKGVYEKRLPPLFKDIERRVYDEHDPLHPATAYRYTKEDIAGMLKKDYPNEFEGKVESVAKQIQTRPSWKKWYYETRKKFIGEDFSSDQSATRTEKFEGVVLDYLMHIRNSKDGTLDKEHKDGMNDEEYRKLANCITPKMAAQWVKEHEADYIEIGEIFRWSTGSLAVEFAKTNEWKTRWDTLGVPQRAVPRRRD